ncbi:hypothetical protein ACNO7K_09235, partial [Bisgaard Taxon 45]
MEESLVKIYKSKKILDTRNNIELKIQNNNIKFLKEILLTNSSFTIDSEENWILQFFIGKSYEQNIVIIFNEHKTNYKE